MRLTIVMLIVIILSALISPFCTLQTHSRQAIGVADAQEDSLVVPGDRVGWMKIGMKFSDITKRLGNDYKTAGSNSSDLVFPKYQLTVSLSSGDTVCGIGVMNSSYRTDAGIQVGSPESAVLSAYGNPESSSSPQGGSCKRLYYKSRGITFVMSSDCKVVSFCIYR